MEYTLTMINSLQMIVHLPILRIILPGNVMMFMQIILPIVMFDVIEPFERFNISLDSLFNFDFKKRSETSQEILNQMRELGYQTHNSLTNLSALSVAIIIYFLRVIVLGMVVVARAITKSSRGEKYVENQKKDLFWNGLLILILEGYLEFLICGYLNL